MRSLLRPAKNTAPATLGYLFLRGLTIQSSLRRFSTKSIAIVLVFAFSGSAPGEAASPQASVTPKNTRQAAWRLAEGEYIASGRYSDALRVVQNMRSYLRKEGRMETGEYIDLTVAEGVVQYVGLGQIEQAALAYQEADDLAIKVFGGESLERVRVLNRKRGILTAQNRFQEAAAAGREAVRIATKARGPDGADTAEALHYLAFTLAKLPDTAETEAVLKRVLEIRQRTDGPDAYWTGLALNNLGVFYLQTKRLPEAVKNLESAARVNRKHTSSMSPDGIATERNAIRLLMDAGLPNSDTKNSAVLAAQKLLRTELMLLRNSFPALHENGKLDFKSKYEPGRWLCTIGDAPSVAAALLQTKAITLDQMLASPAPQSSRSDPFAYLLQPQNAARGFLPATPRTANSARGAAGAPTDQAAESATSPPELNVLYSLTPEQVCAALPRQMVVIEFTRYRHYTGWFTDEDRYGAVVFRPNTKGEQSVAWVQLGPADRIDRAVGNLLESATDALRAGVLAVHLRELYELIWSPLDKTIPPGTEQVFISPDGQLCFLPFSTLLDSQRVFLADRYLVNYLSTARDLFRPDAADRIETDRFAVFASPSFGQTNTVPAESHGRRFRDADARSLRELRLVDLPGARREASILTDLATERRLQPALFTGEAASKTNVERLPRSRIVHFATHGFMLPPATSGALSNVMDRSGLALAGAQATLSAMASGGNIPPIAEDGILTAREIAHLHWHGTWLVTLSACNTARGEVRDGESVLGLRRGFLLAGVENLLLSLWPISDEETVGFMRDFYSRALESNNAGAALALTQREWLGRVRRERGIAAAVTTAGAFILNTSGTIVLPSSRTEPK